MSGYALLKVLHVLVACAGLGTITGVAVLAWLRRDVPASIVVPLTHVASISLGLMLVTGVGMDVAVRGAYHTLLWFRLSGLSLLLSGAAMGVTRRVAKRWNAGKTSADVGLRRVRLASTIGAVLVGFIAVLMEWRPY